jgi:cell division transport system permease protein
MRALAYSFSEAAASLWRARSSSAFAILAIALAILVLGGVLLVTTNVERTVARWSSAAEFSVYLRDDTTSEQRGAIESLIDNSGVAAERQYISKTQALGRFRRDFTELASLTSSFEDNPFPASVEVRVRAEAERNGRAEGLAARLAAAPGVADVRYDKQWISRVTGGLAALRGVGFALGLVMAFAAGLTVATVVRLALHARRDEIEIMQLVGSPLAFIRGPFVVEGLLQGGLGALVALIALWLGFRLTLAWWGRQLAAVLDISTLGFLPISLCLSLVLGGMLVGCLGGFAAARKAV